MHRALRRQQVRQQVILSFILVFFVSTPAAAQMTDSSAPPIGTVFREVPRDLWRFISWDTATVLGVGGGAALVGHIWDDPR